MRNKLRVIKNERMIFIGTFERYGTKNGWKGNVEKTILLKNIKTNNGKEICNHLWFNLTKGFEKLGVLIQGDFIQFEARVKPYVKGYVNRNDYIDDREIDYKLSHPTKIKNIIYKSQSAPAKP